MLLSGIDLHKRPLAILTVDESGTLVRMADRSTRGDVIAACLVTCTGPHRSVVRCTGWWHLPSVLPSARDICRSLTPSIA
jgi:hypothetical protein